MLTQDAPPTGSRPRSLSQSPPAWQREMADAVTDPRELLTMLDLPASGLAGAATGNQLFRLRVPRPFVARMRRGDPADPLLRQVWPLGAESDDVPGYDLDAVGDLASLRGDGIIHKYAGRALLIANGACGVHCRYCFRRHFPYADENAARQQWRGALQQLRADTSIREVILSGGDPLSLADRKLAGLVHALERIPHIERLRLHTRQPIVIPSRVDDALLAWLANTRLQTVVVVHVNHPQELDADTGLALRRLQGTGATLFNQAVLLAGVNDDAEVLAALSERLFAQGVIPYYLHLLDRVRGAAHFDVPRERAQRLYHELSARLPGYLVPHLALEEAGRASKTIIGMDAAPGETAT